MGSLAGSIYLYLTYAVFGAVIVLCVLSILDAIHLPRVRIDIPLTAPHPAPMISVIIPARNEEAHIGRCLESLLTQDYPNFEILVVDDRSTDRTAAIVAEFSRTNDKVRLVHGKRLSDQWLGKSHALHQGVQVAHGSWYLFVDADTWHHPQSLSCSMHHVLSHKVDMLSLYPHFTCKGFWEKVIQPAVGRVILFAAPLALVNSRRRIFRIFYMAIGQFILISRSVYEATGGHATIRNLVTEDVELARLVKQSGHALHFLYGIELLHTDMYSRFSDIWRGWSRSFYPGMGNTLGMAVLDNVLLFIFGTLPYLNLPILVLLVLSGIHSPLVLSLLKIDAHWIAVFATTYVVRQRLNEYPNYFFTCPLGGIMVQWIALHSLYSYAFNKKILWKGRNLNS